MAKIRYFSGLHFLPLELLGDLGLELHISNLGAIYKGRPKIFAIFTHVRKMWLFTGKIWLFTGKINRCPHLPTLLRTSFLDDFLGH